jgi:hypothetical protein
MKLTSKPLILLLGVAAMLLTSAAKEKERPKFSPGPAASYTCRQTSQNVTIGAAALLSDTQTAPAFGKLNPNDLGILPVLVVIQNDTDQTLALENMKVELTTPDRQHVEATRPADLRYLHGAGRPGASYPSPVPGASPRVSRKKNPLASWEIEGRAFVARMLPPKERASGFFYFRTPFREGSTLYLTGLREAQTGKELFYFEILLEK